MSDVISIDEVVKFGHPWHGLYSNATGNVTPPAGPAFAIPGVPPNGDLFNPPGFCVKLAKPGLPAVSNDAADIAAGRTWLNYALLSGGYQRLYGRDMGGPIYIAGDGSAWHVDINRNPTSAGGVTRLEIILNLTNFGEISDPAAAVVTQSTAMVNAPFTGGDITGYGVLSIVEDINENGSKFLISVFVPLPATPIPSRRVLGLFEVTIAGIPPAATASITKLADIIDSAGQTTSMNQVWKIAYLDNNSAPQYLVQANPAAPGWVARNNWRSWPVSQNDYNEQTDLIGARYVAGVAQVMTLYRKEHFTGTGDIAISGVVTSPVFDCLFTFTKSSTYTVSAELRAAGVAIFSQSYSVTASGTASVNLSAAGSPVSTYSSSTIFNFGSGGSTTIPNIEDWVYGQIGGAASFAHLGPNGGPNPYTIFGGWRYSNTVYGLINREPLLPDTPLTDNVIFRGVVGALGSDSTIYAPTPFSSGAKYASEHPVTGAIARDTTPVCWI